MQLHDPLDLDGAAQADVNRENAEHIKRHYEIADLKWLMANRQGRRFVWRLFEKYGVHTSSFRSDALVMAFLEGQRNCGLQLLADCLLECPERYAEMLKEHGRASNTDKRPGANANAAGSNSSTDAASGHDARDRA